MNGFKDLFFAILNEVSKVADEFDGNPVYEPIVQKLRAIDVIAEDMYVNMPSSEDEVSEEDDKM